MTKEIYLEAKRLQDKICNLEIQKYKLLNSGNITAISLRKDSWFRSTTFDNICCAYLNSNKLKEFILNEINEKLVKLRKEFSEL